MPLFHSPCGKLGGFFPAPVCLIAQVCRCLPALVLGRKGDEPFCMGDPKTQNIAISFLGMYYPASNPFGID